MSSWGSSPRPSFEGAKPPEGVLPRTVAVPGGGSLRYRLRLPAAGFPARGSMVAVHGISRNCDEIVAAFSGLADELGFNLVVPFFGKRRFGGYQRLVDERGRRADEALLAVLADCAALLPNQFEQVDLFGFSGGAQFAHRFALVHPERVRSIFAMSAGFYTFPRRDRPYPYGLGAAEEGQSPSFQLLDYLRIPTTVAVGEADTGRDDALRQGRLLDHEQGSDRVERAMRFALSTNLEARMNGLPPAARFRKLAGAGHDFADCVSCGLNSLVAEHLRWARDRDGARRAS